MFRAFPGLVYSVSAVSEVVATFAWEEFGDELADAVPEGVAGPFGVFAEPGFQLREEQFDGVEIGAVRRQVCQGATGGLDGFADAGAGVAAEVVHHHDVAGRQRRGELLWDVRQKQLAVRFRRPVRFSNAFLMLTKSPVFRGFHFYHAWRMRCSTAENAH